MSSSCAPSTSSDESASAPTNSRVSISESGSNEIVRAFGLPPPQLPRCSHTSGRAVHTTTTGPEAVLSIKPSRKSKTALSAQGKSSTTTTTGPLAPPALADPGNAHDRHQLHRPLRPAALKRVSQQPPFPLAANERRPVAHGDRDGRARLTCYPAGKRLRFALRHHRLVRLVHDHP